VGDPFDMEMARERREELLREAEERRIAGTLRRARRDVRDGRHEKTSRLEGVEVRWGHAEEESAVADLLELNGMPRWIAFEERFVVAKKDGKVLGAVRYRTESKRLLLGLLVVDPWAGEERVAQALYRGAGELAGEMGVGEVVVSASRAGYPGSVGYRRWGRGWRLDVGAPLSHRRRATTGERRRLSSLLVDLVGPFYRTFQRSR
jgi:predicted N-acetyltransferase YhbS